MPSLEVSLAGFAALDEAGLARPWSWQGKPLDVRYALYRTLEEAQEAQTRVAAESHPESRRILSLAQRAFGDLRGLLVGLPADLLDRKPAPEEWPLRETLRHMLAVEQRYMLQTIYAIERADADPMKMTEDRLPTAAKLDASGDLPVVLGRLAGARAETNRRLGEVTPAGMTRPTIWVHWDIDVRFRLHRFAAHVVEHTIQCEKTLEAIGWRATEGRRIARQISALIGEIEGLAALAEVRKLEARAAERLASIS